MIVYDQYPHRDALVWMILTRPFLGRVVFALIRQAQETVACYLGGG
jgi:hypothetical protein